MSKTLLSILFKCLKPADEMLKPSHPSIERTTPSTIGNDHQHSESDDHYPSSRIFLALRSGGTHCLVEVTMLLRPPQVLLV
jgi:hypothetical protein